MKKGYREEVSPIDYFPDDPEIVVKRVTFLDGDKDVGFVDLHLTEDTVYYLYLEVKPEYRGQKFIEFMSPEKQETKQKFTRPKTVWLNINPQVAKNSSIYLNARRQFNKEGKTVPTKIYMNGTKLSVEET